MEELSYRGDSSEFLTPAEQEMLRTAMPYTKFEGGYEGAERNVAIFGDGSAEIACIAITQTAKKFAKELSHRDYLGALMSLGVKREVMGDILVDDKMCYLFCLERMADFIINELQTAGRASVKARRSEVPDIEEKLLDGEYVVISSERIDVIVAAVFNLSRSVALKLFDEERVFIGGRLVKSASHLPAEGDIISVRKIGRVKYGGIDRQTKKGKLRVLVYRYK